MLRWSVALVVAMLLQARAVGAEDARVGYLLLRALDHAGSIPGSREAGLFVYDATGAPVVAGGTAGAFRAGAEVPVAEGWYFVEVAGYPTRLGLQKLYVAAGKVTVVPSGWVSVSTPPVESQPRQGCRAWVSELNAFASDEAGRRQLLQSNQDVAPTTEGAIQLPTGPATVVFNGVPVRVEVREGQTFQIATGYQMPGGDADEQLVIKDAGGNELARVSLCVDGATQVPAGTYALEATRDDAATGRAVRSSREVTVAATAGGRYSGSLDPTLGGRRYSGPGSSPAAPGAQDAAALARIRGASPSGGPGRGGPIRLGGRRGP
jgi:hypothetical protein